MTSIISALGRGTPRQLVEETFFFNSWKQPFSLSVHRQGLVFSIRSVRGAYEYVKLSATETPNVVQTVLRVVTYLHVLQGSHLGCGWFPPAIPNVKTQILHLLTHELSFLKFDVEMVFLTDNEKLL